MRLLNIVKERIFNQTIFLAILSAVGASMYLDFPIPRKTVTSFFFVAFLYFFSKLWTILRNSTQRKSLFVIAFVFSVFTFSGKALDTEMHISATTIILFSFFLSFSIYPLLLQLTEWCQRIEEYEKKSVSKKLERICFASVCIVYFLGYLAAFPGIYANDAQYWYLEFSDSEVPILSQWSPFYAYIFYIFVHTGYILFGNYETGMGVFSFIQMIFVLLAIYKIIHFSAINGGFFACIITSLFYCIPSHLVITVQTAQAVPFMIFFSLIFLSLYDMGKNPKLFWKSWKKILALCLSIVFAAIFRSNGYVAFIVFLPFILFLSNKENKGKLFLCFFLSLAVVTGYKKILLPSLSVKDADAIGSSLSLPLQQLSAAYNLSEKLTESQRHQIEEYIGPEQLKFYFGNESISDHAKRKFNANKFKESPVSFLKLYIKVGAKAPKQYVYAFLMQCSGLLFIDKSYPEHKIWHAYLGYTNYWYNSNGNRIGIKRIPLFPLYDKVLMSLFGDTIEGYGGASNACFAKIPLLGLLIKCSTYFWGLVFLTFYVVIRRKTDSFLSICLSWCFMLSVLLAPLIMYRYCAPLIFVFPILIVEILSKKRNDDRQKSFV